MLVGQRKKSQKYFDLSTFNYNLYDSNPCSSLGVMNFQKWELFSGSPGRFGTYAHFLKNKSGVDMSNATEQSYQLLIRVTDFDVPDGCNFVEFYDNVDQIRSLCRHFLA